MTATTITAAGASDSLAISSGNDGTLVIQSGPTGAKVDAVSLDASGNATMKGVRSSNTSGVGYTTGAGGTVTQLTSKGTAVTLNTPSGQITMNNAALAANTVVYFQLINSVIAASDVVVVVVKGGFATNITYRCWAEETVAGSCKIVLENRSGGSLSEAVIINFAVIKGATS